MKYSILVRRLNELEEQLEKRLKDSKLMQDIYKMNDQASTHYFEGKGLTQLNLAIETMNKVIDKTNGRMTQ